MGGTSTAMAFNWGSAAAATDCPVPGAEAEEDGVEEFVTAGAREQIEEEEEQEHSAEAEISCLLKELVDLKAQANQVYQEGDVRQALELYQRAIDRAAAGPANKECDDLVSALHLNAALMLQKLGTHGPAVEHCILAANRVDLQAK